MAFTEMAAMCEFEEKHVMDLGLGTKTIKPVLHL